LEEFDFDHAPGSNVTPTPIWEARPRT
jgi:hypothetical protein